MKEGPVLAGRTALATGSGRGIGQAIALALANVGADIAVHGTGDPADCDTTARLVAATGRRTAVFRHDLGEPEAGRLLAEAAVAALGQVDILVLNAADQIRKPWAELTQDDMEQQYRINVAAAHASAAALAPAMAERGWGRILAIGSVQQAKPHPDMLGYAASKHALHGMVKSLASQLAPSGVTVNLLAPGVIPTARNEEALTDPAYRARVLSAIPAGRFGSPKDCAFAALMLCRPEANYITGNCLFVDGGLHGG